MSIEERKFSIIVPVYNGQDVIEHCIQSILALDYTNWELIIINDGSTDATMEQCTKYLFDRRIELINKENAGVSSSRNKGIEEATGEYVIFSDADDYVDKNICSIFNQAMQESQFCIAGYTCCFEDGTKYIAKISNNIAEGKYSKKSFEHIFGELYKSGFLNSPWTKCYRRDLIKQQFNSNYSLGEDLIFNLYYLMNCSSVTVTFQSVYFYNIYHSGTLSSSLIENGFETLFNVYDETKILLKKMYNSNTEIYRSIDEKYILDMMVMLERNIRYNEHFKMNDIINICKQYGLIYISKKTSLKSINKKWEIGRCLISHEAYLIFHIYIKFLFYLKSKKYISIMFK